jgi:hypothetical protein
MSDATQKRSRNMNFYANLLVCAAVILLFFGLESDNETPLAVWTLRASLVAVPLAVGFSLGAMTGRPFVGAVIGGALFVVLFCVAAIG